MVESKNMGAQTAESSKTPELGNEGKAKDHAETGYISIRTGGITNVVGWAIIFVGLYLVLSNFPIFSSKGIDPKTGLVIVFFTGILTSLHCVGMCSGFVISYAANSNNKGMKPHLCYNGSRLFSYVVLGVLLGLIGSIFTFSDQLRSYLSVGAGLFMIVYGSSMFFPQLRRFVTLPGLDVHKYTNGNPVLFGLLNGLMPCGPLQAMLIYAAGTGSAIEGGLTMLAFGLGTVPLMLLMGLGVSAASMKWTHKIVKFSGALVIVLGIILLSKGFLLTGISLPFIPSVSAASVISSTSDSASGLSTQIPNGFQEINMTVTPNGWQPNHFVVKKGMPVRWNVYVKQLSGCVSGLKAPSLGISYYFQRDGETKTFEFTPTQAGTIAFTCPMGMVSGSIEVKDDVTLSAAADANVAATTAAINNPPAQTGGCGCGGGTGGSCH
jgi:sulfite exporter TauE/SafE